MAIRLILYDVIPLLVGRPPPLEKTALSLVKHMRRYDGRDGYNVMVLEYHDHAAWAPPFSPFSEREFCDREAAGLWRNNGRVVVTRYGDGLDGHPLHRTLVSAALTLKDKIDAAEHARDAIGAFLAEFDEPTKVRLNVLELRGHEASGRGFWYRFRVSEGNDEVEPALDGEDGTESVFEEFLSEYDEMVEAFGDILGFGGHAMRDWGYWFWVMERGPDEFMEIERG